MRICFSSILMLSKTVRCRNSFLIPDAYSSNHQLGHPKAYAQPAFQRQLEGSLDGRWCSNELWNPRIQGQRERERRRQKNRNDSRTIRLACRGAVGSAFQLLLHFSGLSVPLSQTILLYMVTSGSGSASQRPSHGVLLLLQRSGLMSDPT